MKEFATRHIVLDEEKRAWPQVLFLGAHTDDDAMFRLTVLLNEYGIGVTIATLTNSDARNLPLYTPEELAEKRWKEVKASGKEGGVTEVWRLESPDGKLHAF